MAKNSELQTLILIMLLVLLSFQSGQSQESALNLNCYHYNMGMASYHLDKGELDKSGEHLELASSVRQPLPQDEWIAAKIDIKSGEISKAILSLSVLVHKGYNYKSLEADPVISDFLSKNESARETLEFMREKHLARLDTLSINSRIDHLFSLDQSNRSHLRNGSYSSQDFDEKERSIRDVLINEIIGNTGIPPLSLIGFSRHSKLYFILLHHISSKGEGRSIKEWVDLSFQQGNFSSLEYARLLDRMYLVEEGSYKYGVTAFRSKLTNDMALGANVENLEKIDSIRYTIGLFPLECQANMSGTSIEKGYEPQYFDCVPTATKSKKLQTIRLRNG